MDGWTWEELVTAWRDTHLLDQGAEGTLLGEEITDAAFWYTTDGDYGVRLDEGVLSADKTRNTMVFAADISVDEADPVALFKRAQAGVRVNGGPPFPSLTKSSKVFAS